MSRRGDSVNFKENRISIVREILWLGRQRPVSKGPEFLEFLARPGTATCSIRRSMDWNRTLERGSFYKFANFIVNRAHVRALRTFWIFDFRSIRCSNQKREIFRETWCSIKFRRVSSLFFLKVFSRCLYTRIIVSFAFPIFIEVNISSFHFKLCPS